MGLLVRMNEKGKIKQISEREGGRINRSWK